MSNNRPSFRKSVSLKVTVERTLEEPLIFVKSPSKDPSSPTSRISTPTIVSERKSLLIRTDTHDFYKKTHRRNVIWGFIVFMAILLERLFAQDLHYHENSAIIWLQRTFRDSIDHFPWLLRPVLLLENHIFFYLLLTHVFVTLYYYVNPIMSKKIMQVTLNSLILVVLAQILSGEPRPFWTDKNIIPATCEGSFAFPSMSLFGTTLLCIYVVYCFKQHNEDYFEVHPWRKAFLYGGIAILMSGLVFTKILAGTAYISQAIVTMGYATVTYILVVFFDKSITKIVESSSVDTHAAKRNNIFWLIYLIIIGALCTFVYNGVKPFVDITWLQNQATCIARQDQYSDYDTLDYYHAIGAWESYKKVLVVPMLLGTVFGIAKTFEDFNGLIWYSVNTRRRIAMTFIANLCLVPSWLFFAFQTKILAMFVDDGINYFLVDASHFAVLYFVLFGVLPKHVFGKLNLINQKTEYQELVHSVLECEEPAL